MTLTIMTIMRNEIKENSVLRAIAGFLSKKAGSKSKRLTRFQAHSRSETRTRSLTGKKVGRSVILAKQTALLPFDRALPFEQENEVIQGKSDKDG